MKKTIEATVADTIALCYIRNDFEEFNKNLTTFLKTAVYKGEPLSKLDKISHGKKVLFARNTKKFYRKNKNVIDIINKHSDIVSFIYQNYNLIVEKENIEFDKKELYQYIVKNELKMVKILTLLNKLKELGITHFDFNEDIDFTKEKHTICNNYNANYSIVYFDNIEVIPSYDKNKTMYRTNSSNYKLIIYSQFGNLSSRGNYITLNDLTFDINRLPKTLEKSTTFDTIIKQVEEKELEYITIRNSVDLSANIDELITISKQINYIIDNIENEYCKDELSKVVTNIMAQIPAMQNICSLYENSVIEKNNFITSKILETEKKSNKIKTRKQ